MSYLDNRRRKKHTSHRTGSNTPFGLIPNTPVFQPSYHSAHQSIPRYGYYSPTSSASSIVQQRVPYYGNSTSVGHNSCNPVSPPPPHPYGPMPQVASFEKANGENQSLQRPPQMKLPPVVGGEQQQVTVQLPSSPDHLGNNPSKWDCLLNYWLLFTYYVKKCTFNVSTFAKYLFWFEY